MKTVIISSLFAASLLTTSIASAQFQPRTCDLPTYDHELIRLAPLPPCPPTTGARINFTADSLAFEHGVTIDFADYTVVEPGPLHGYVYIRVQGRWFLMPYYALRAQGR